MNPRPPRILIVSSVIPARDRGGGCLALHRHFCEHSDFEVAIASRYVAHSAGPETYQLRAAWPWMLARKSPLGRLAINVDFLRAARILPAGLVAFAGEWRPDLIFSVADDLHAMAGLRLARTLGVPYAIDFQDLFACSGFTPRDQRPLRSVRSLLLARYRKMQAEADAVFHISPGMREWFGASARGEVLYPIGAPARPAPPHHAPPNDRLTLIYAGNCYGPYGSMVLQLARNVVGYPQLSFSVYSMGVDWLAADLARFSQAGIYRGFLPFERLEDELGRSGAALVVMSFRPEDRTFVETSFPSKWSDYAAAGRPILVWAPAYSTAARFVRETKAGVLVDDPAPSAVVAAAERLRLDPVRWRAAAEAAARTAASELNSDRLHALLCTRLLSTIASRTGSSGDTTTGAGSP